MCVNVFYIGESFSQEETQFTHHFLLLLFFYTRIWGKAQLFCRDITKKNYPFIDRQKKRDKLFFKYTEKFPNVDVVCLNKLLEFKKNTPASP